MTPMPAPPNFLSFDVECWFHAHNLRGAVAESDWDRLDLRVERPIHAILELLDRHATRATFFVLGWLAERRPDLVALIEGAGHELASHGYSHRLVSSMSEAEFADDLRRSLGAIGAASSGAAVAGFRASNFSIDRRTPWAFDRLHEAGFRYDSSVFPVGGRRYGIAGYPELGPHDVTTESGALVRELPLSVLPLGRRRLPFGGGGYLRLYPRRVTSAAITRANRAGRPANVYLHPWELDPQQPRLRVGRAERFKHYVNLDQTAARLEHLLQRHAFTTLGSAVAADGHAHRTCSERWPLTLSTDRTVAC